MKSDWNILDLYDVMAIIGDLKVETTVAIRNLSVNISVLVLKSQIDDLFLENL